MSERPTGSTLDAGYQIGVSKTLPLPAEQVWRFIAGPEGLPLWLGDIAPGDLRKGAAYRTADGTSGEVRGRLDGTRLRLTHRPPGGAETTVQITVTAKGGSAVLGFHQERMSGPQEREEQRAHWRAVMSEVEAALLPAAGTGER
ncbi:SRPBCC family protein [Nocardiopsis composta]|uniref:Uncharacterized protein YndB with AHSA1/START domain n=1 Tax=Nocardiopsis composta TaxID=157465 RepID=A0A7W8QHP8_9ACTN|nr:SRPBCC domain-containing protein [Nocardiopsis composta]MBB5430414.1 uncharacterized protein YndB with AHSA1/START domain [Nocardiopsis composta]